MRESVPRDGSAHDHRRRLVRSIRGAWGPGLGALIDLSREAEEAETTFAVRNPSDRVLRLLELTGPAGYWSEEPPPTRRHHRLGSSSVRVGGNRAVSTDREHVTRGEGRIVSEPDDASATIALPDGVDAPRVARGFVAQHADSLTPELIADAELVVTEIVTNAVLHGRPAITLSLDHDPPGIGVSVHDHGANLPTADASAPAPTQTSGRGMLIIDSLASDWGVTIDDLPPGKTVWFRLEPS